MRLRKKISKLFVGVTVFNRMTDPTVMKIGESTIFHRLVVGVL